MAPEKSPAFQFYPKEFLMDGNVAAMSLQERGAYITLLCICWQEKSLPAELGRLANIVGLPVKTFQKIWPPIAGCFVQQGDRLFHPRLDKEREKQDGFSKRQSNAAEARWNKPKASQANATAHTKPVPKPCSPVSDLRSPISDLQVTDFSESVPLDVAFEQFKAAYPGHRRVDNLMTRQRFVDACQRIGYPAVIAKLEEQKQSDEWAKKGLVPSMQKWFEDKHYEREAAPAAQTGLSRVTEAALRAVREAQ